MGLLCGKSGIGRIARTGSRGSGIWMCGLLSSLLMVTFFLFSCEMDPSQSTSDETDSVIISGYKIKGGEESVYYYKHIDLETMSEVSDPASAAWDIQVTGAREILTNSGVTANGSGGVAFSGTTDFSASIPNPESLEYEKDYTYWEYYKTSLGSFSEPQTYTVNVISFPGYKNTNGYNGGAGDGTADGLTSDTAYYRENIDFSQGHAFAKWSGMPPSFFDFSKNVYVIRSGDGASYYKFQILFMEYTTDVLADGTKKVTYSFEVRVAKLK